MDVQSELFCDGDSGNQKRLSAHKTVVYEQKRLSAHKTVVYEQKRLPAHKTVVYEQKRKYKHRNGCLRPAPQRSAVSSARDGRMMSGR